MEDIQIQWHPGFIAAMNLEMADNRDSLRFLREFNLNLKPLEIDLIITKEDVETEVDNEIGKLFRGHNIIEYKAPADHLDIDVFFKVTGYACLYKSYGEKVDLIKEDDITLTLIRDTKPIGLLRYFTQHGYRISNPYCGIYYVEGKVVFPAQIVVTRELESENHIWLKALSDNMGKQDMRKLLERIRGLDGKFYRELADAVLDVVLKANMELIAEFIGDEDMSEALLEIIRPIIEPQLLRREEERLNEGLEKGLRQGLQLGLKQGIEQGRQQGLEQGMEQGRQQGLEQGMEQGRQQGLEQGMKKGIEAMVGTLRDFGHSDAEIKMAIVKKYDLTEAEACQYL